MPPVVLPPSFGNSFWSQDYRRGLDVLYAKMEQGVAEDEEVITFLKAQAQASQQYADALNRVGNEFSTGLTSAFTSKGKGFERDEGASLVFAFRGLQAQSISLAQTHENVSNSLNSTLIGPFASWSAAHSSRISESKKAILDKWIRDLEIGKEEVNKAKEKMWRLEREKREAEEEVGFVGIHIEGEDVPPPAGSTNLAQGGVPKPVRRQGTISERLRAQLSSAMSPTVVPSTPPESPVVFQAPGTPDQTPPDSAKTTTPKDDDRPPIFQPEKPLPDDPTSSSEPASFTAEEKGKGKEDASVPLEKPSIPSIDTAAVVTPLPPSRSDSLSTPGTAGGTLQLLLAGVHIEALKVDGLLQAAKGMLNMKTVRYPVLGEYTNCFSGKDFVAFLKDCLPELEGSQQKADIAAKDLIEVIGVAKRVGTVTNRFEATDEALYQFKDKAMNLQAELLRQQISSPASPASAVSPISRSLTSATAKSSSTIGSYLSKALTPGPSVPPHIRAKMAYDDADSLYRVAVRNVDLHRMRTEEVIEETLKLLQRWERDRLIAVKTVLTEFHKLAGTIPGALQAIDDTTQLLLDSYKPEADLAALIQRYRVGSFRPQALIYEAASRDINEVIFGGSLTKWANGIGWKLPSDKATMPEEGTVALLPNAPRALLRALTEAYPSLPDDEERRRAWIYEVPLAAAHALRSQLINLPKGAAEIPPGLCGSYDVPVIIANLRLWLLELEPAVGPQWDEVKSLYPTAGTGTERDSDELKKEELKSILSRISKIQLVVLDAVIGHLRNLINTTKSEEEDLTFISKLAISLGRAILRPEVDTEITIQDRSPVLFFTDLLVHYSDVFPVVINLRRQDVEERLKPQRKNTRPVDRRLSRSNMSPEELKEFQTLALLGKTPSSPAPPSPNTPKRVYVSESEARKAAAEAAEAEASSPTSEPRKVFHPITAPQPKRLSLLGRLSAPGPDVPSGISIEAPTPIELSKPMHFHTEPIPPPPTVKVEVPVSPQAQDGVQPPQGEETPTFDKDQPFVPPNDDRDEPFVPPNESADAPFSPPDEDSSTSDTPSFVPPHDDQENGGETVTAAAASLSRRVSAEAGKRLAGPRPGGARPGGARTAPRKSVAE